MLNMLPQVDMLIQPPSSILMIDNEGLTITNLFNLAFGILGGIALIMIVLQGIRYALSDGDPGKTTQARNGIIYAVVGIVVALTGASITNFVLEAALPAATDQTALVGMNSVLSRVAGILSIVVGAISVIMIIVNGYKFALSNGDSSKAASARNGIIYALVGAVIAAVAGPILLFAIERLTT